jgi:histidinol-phosphate aminotransferase
MTEREPRPRPEILTIPAYAGGEAKLPGTNRVIKLSSNEGAFGPPASVREAYICAADQLNRYPDGSSAELRRAIGKRFSLDPDRVVCGTGSEELITLLCHAYAGPGASIVMSRHGFSMYRISGTYAGSWVVKAPERNYVADVDNMLAAVTADTRLVFITNPNNPTGTLLPQSEIERLHRSLPANVLLVIDAAYAEYVAAVDYDPGIKLANTTNNTFMLRTFSKTYGLAGMRIGWGYGPPGVIDALNRIRGVFNVNVAAQAAAVAVLAEVDWIARLRTHNTIWRAKLSASLRAAGIAVCPTEANFVLADFGSAEQAGEANSFLKSRGIIVRGMASYDLPHCLRITVGTEPECTAVAEGLAAFITQKVAGG